MERVVFERLMKKNCLNCKYCIKNGDRYTDIWIGSHGFRCEMKRKEFSYGIFQILKGMLCSFYKEKENPND